MRSKKPVSVFLAAAASMLRVALTLVALLVGETSAFNNRVSARRGAITSRR